MITERKHEQQYFGLPERLEASGPFPSGQDQRKLKADLEYIPTSLTFAYGLTDDGTPAINISFTYPSVFKSRTIDKVSISTIDNRHKIQMEIEKFTGRILNLGMLGVDLTERNLQLFSVGIQKGLAGYIASEVLLPEKKTTLLAINALLLKNLRPLTDKIRAGLKPKGPSGQ